ncbi:MAG TPA: HD-GYP domain-containing protein [Burkholderiales bacterium]
MLIKIEPNDLRIGMFIAELDRPWIDTPFLLQGFLVEDEVELSQLRRYCKFVLVDPRRSAAGLFPELEEPRSQPRAFASPTSAVDDSHRAKGSNKAAGGSRPEFSEQRDARFHLSDSGRFKVIMVDGPQSRAPERPAPLIDSADQSRPGRFGSFFERLGDLFRAQSGRRGIQGSAAIASHALDDAEDLQRGPAHHDFIPASIQITVHPETKTIEEEIEPARQAYARVEDLTLQVVDDIRNGKLVAISQIETVIRDVVDSMMRSADALIWIARLKRQETAIYGHSLQVAVYLVALGRHLGLPKEQLSRLGMLGLLLDVGKTKLPRTLLAKPGTLTPDEFDLVKQHVRVGLDLLRPTPDLHPEILHGVAQHHEREDGSGYPEGLDGGRISLFGRMAAIADSFVALTNARPHVSAISSYEALRKLATWGGTLFHASLVEQFIQTIGVFPVGSLVELSSGEVAVIVRQSKVRRLKPRLLVISGPDKAPAPSPSMLDLLYQSADREPVHIVRGLAAGAYGLDAREYFLS